MIAPCVARSVADPVATPPLSMPVTVAPDARARLVLPLIVVNEAAPAVSAEEPMSIAPKPLVIEPELSAPVVTSVLSPT